MAVPDKTDKAASDLINSSPPPPPSLLPCPTALTGQSFKGLLWTGTTAGWHWLALAGLGCGSPFLDNSCLLVG